MGLRHIGLVGSRFIPSSVFAQYFPRKNQSKAFSLYPALCIEDTDVSIPKESAIVQLKASSRRDRKRRNQNHLENNVKEVKVLSEDGRKLRNLKLNSLIHPLPVAKLEDNEKLKEKIDLESLVVQCFKSGLNTESLQLPEEVINVIGSKKMAIGLTTDTVNKALTHLASMSPLEAFYKGYMASKAQSDFLSNEDLRSKELSIYAKRNFKNRWNPMAPLPRIKPAPDQKLPWFRDSHVLCEYLEKIGQVEENIDAICDLLARHKIIVNPEVASVTFRLFAQFGEYRRALQVYYLLRQRQVHFTPAGYTNLLQCLAVGLDKEGPENYGVQQFLIREAHDIFCEIKDPSIIHYNVFLNICVKTRNVGGIGIGIQCFKELTEQAILDPNLHPDNKTTEHVLSLIAAKNNYNLTAQQWDLELQNIQENKELAEEFRFLKPEEKERPLPSRYDNKSRMREIKGKPLRNMKAQKDKNVSKI